MSSQPSGSTAPAGPPAAYSRDDPRAADLHPPYRVGRPGYRDARLTTLTSARPAARPTPALRGPSSGLAVIMLAASVIP